MADFPNKAMFTPKKVVLNQPYVFNDAVSMLEFCAQIQGKVNDIIQYLEQIDAENKVYTDEQIRVLKDYVIESDNIIKKLVVDTSKGDRAYTDTLVEVTKQLLLTLVDDTRKALINYTDLGDAKLKQYFDNQFDEIWGIINEFEYVVIDNVTGNKGTIQQALDSLYELMRSGSLTCIEYDALQLTCEQFDAKQITASEFDLNSKSILKV